MERLHQLVSTGRYDRIVLDTPPTRNALDFLDAPGRLLRFLEGRSLRMFLRPSLRAGRFGMRLAGRGANVAFAALERLTGVALLRDLSEFFLAFEGMVDGFHDRAAAVAELLASDRATFLVVTAPAAEPIDEAVFFVHALAERGLPFGGVIANRVDESPLPEGVDGSGPRRARTAMLRRTPGRHVGVQAATACSRCTRRCRAAGAPRPAPSGRPRAAARRSANRMAAAAGRRRVWTRPRSVSSPRRSASSRRDTWPARGAPATAR